MNYLTQYYKNLSEQLQEKLNTLEKQVNEAFIRNPRDQKLATQRTTKDGLFRDPTRGDIFRGSAGWDRMEQMMHFKAAHAIADPHEKEAIEAVLADMAKTEDPAGEYEKLPYGSPETPKFTKGEKVAGTAANMQSMRTALGALKRLKGTEEFGKSLSSVQDPIEREALNRVQKSDNPIYGVDIRDYRGGQFTERESERMDDQIFNVSQEQILGKPRRKK